jgi:hypothetical protein
MSSQEPGIIPILGLAVDSLTQVYIEDNSINKKRTTAQVEMKYLPTQGKIIYAAR